MMRSSEAVQLSMDNVWIEQLDDGQEVLFVFIDHSKTDQHHIGHTVVLGHTESTSRDAVQWFKTYITVRKEIKTGTGNWLFVNMYDGSKLSKNTPNHVLKNGLKAIGINPTGFGSHSARRGGATAASEQGVIDLLIKRQGNWRSDAVYRYIDLPIHSRAAVNTAMMSARNPGPQRDPKMLINKGPMNSQTKATL